MKCSATARASESLARAVSATALMPRFRTAPATRSRDSTAGFQSLRSPNLNVSAAGIEAQHALADAIAERAVARGRLHYREAWLYFESRMTAVSYILSASPTSAEGHDVADFLETFEKACTAPCSPLTRNDVQRRSLLALADPLLYLLALRLDRVVYRQRKHDRARCR